MSMLLTPLVLDALHTSSDISKMYVSVSMDQCHVCVVGLGGLMTLGETVTTLSVLAVESISMLALTSIPLSSFLCAVNLV